MGVSELQLSQRSNHFIWTDEHISKNMLAAHLNLENDAASRNIGTIKKTIEWIESKLPKGAKILDLGCGPGLYASLLAERGYSVTGIDISERSIAYAGKEAIEKNLHIHYLCMDYLTADIGTGYDAVICIYCDFGALIPHEQELLLGKIHRSLNAGGQFIFDVFQPGLCENKKEGKDWYYSDGGDFWSSRPYLLLEETKHFREEAVWGRRTIIIEENRMPREYITWDHYYSQSKIQKLLNENEFEIQTVNTDLIASNDFTSKDVMFIEAKKQ